MYTLLYLILLAIAGGFIYSGLKNEKSGRTIFGAILVVLTILFFWFMNFWGEKLWFDQTGFAQRFWIEWGTKLLLFVGGFLFGGIFVLLFTLSLKKEKRHIKYLAMLAGALLSAFWWFSHWEVLLKFMNAMDTGLVDPILEMDAGFYLFSLPFYQAIYKILLFLSLISLVASIVAVFEVSEDQNQFRLKKSLPGSHSMFISAGLVLIVMASGRILSRYSLLYSGYGIVTGPGWTDDKIRLPMLTIVAIITLITGIMIIIPRFRAWVYSVYHKNKNFGTVSPVFTTAGALFLIWLLLLGIVPALFQWLKVEPNEITVERPYIEHNIEYTRHGFNLDEVEEREYPATEEISRQTIEDNRNLLSNIRLWDYRALDAVYKQFQEIRLYYEFHDVDIDRYTIGDQYREVMISAREMETRNLPPNSQTFVNKRFKYTHGYGAVLNLVNEFTPEGLPNLLLKDIPPVSEYPVMQITRPEVYYGELTNDHVVANSEEEEFDYPAGENNVYTRYGGSGGVPVSNFWKKFLFGWKFDGTRFLFSSYISNEARLMMHRNIKDRVNTLAPFLSYDDDPYITIINGQMHWIIDAYTTSGYYPYSEKFSGVEAIGYGENLATQDVYNELGAELRAKNYMRNSVKVAVNTYNGEVNFYIFEEEDPIINVYEKIFPGLLKSKSEMPEAMMEHVRYPSDMLLVQGLIYAKYHMTDPTVFYNQEDLWVRATEKYYNNVQAVEPYYIMWEQPESDDMEFTLILPFTPKNKQVMIGWIAGLCDGENYGRLLAYKFPKEKRVLGTQQVETKIDQDAELSGQLTLWDQRGSSVVRGNVLTIPINNTIIYVEPIYLKSETAAYPELRLVAVMHNDNLSYAETFEKALEGLFAGVQPRVPEAKGGLTGRENLQELINKANDAFGNYLNSMQQRQFSNAGSALNELEEVLNQLSEQSENNQDQNKN